MIKPFELFYRGIAIAIFWWGALALYTKHMHPMESLTADLTPRLVAVVCGLSAAMVVLITHLWAKRKEVMLAREPVNVEGLQINLGDHFYWNKSEKHDLAIIDDILERLPKSAQTYVSVLKSLISEIEPSKQQKIAYRAISLVDKAEKFNYEGLVSIEPPIRKNADWYVLGGDCLVALLSIIPELTWVELRQRKILSDLSVADRRTLLQVALLYLRPQQMPLVYSDDILHVADDRICALMELLREEVGLISSKYQTPAYQSLLQEDSGFVEIFDFLHEPERFNGGNQDRRIGFIYEDILYLNVVKYTEVINEKREKVEKPRAQKQQLILELLRVFGDKSALVKRINQQEVVPGSLFRVEFSGKIGKDDKVVVFPEMLLIAWQDVLPLLGHEGDSALKPKVLNLVRIVKEKSTKKNKTPKEKQEQAENPTLELAFDHEEDQAVIEHSVIEEVSEDNNSKVLEETLSEDLTINVLEETNDIPQSIEIPSFDEVDYPEIEIEPSEESNIEIEPLDFSIAPDLSDDFQDLEEPASDDFIQEEVLEQEVLSNDQLVDAVIKQIQKHLLLNMLNGVKKLDGVSEFIQNNYQYYAIHLAKVEAGCFAEIKQEQVALLVAAGAGERFQVQHNKAGDSLKLRGEVKEILQNPIKDSVSHAKDKNAVRPTFFISPTVKIDKWRPAQIKTFKSQLEDQLVAYMRRNPEQNLILKKVVDGKTVAEFKLSDAFAIGLKTAKLNQFVIQNPEGCTLVDESRENRIRVTLLKEKEALDV